MRDIKTILENQVEDINEAFLNPFLMEIVKIIQDSDAKAEKEWSGDEPYGHFSFGGKLGNLRARWDKVTDSDIEFIDTPKGEAYRRIIAKAIRSGRAVIFMDRGKGWDHVYTNAGAYYGGFISLTSKKSELSEQPLTTDKAVVETLQGCKRLAILIVSNELSNYDLKVNRSNAKSGAIPDNPKEREEFYNQLLDRQLQKYKEEITKIRASKDTWFDSVSKEIDKTVQRFFQLSVKINSDIKVYAGCNWQWDSVAKTVCDEVYFGTVGGKFRQLGSKSLLSCVREYTEANMKRADGYTYAPTDEDMEKLKKAIIEANDFANKKMDEFEKRVKEKHA